MSKHVTGQLAERRPAQAKRLSKQQRRTVKRVGPYNSGLPPRVVVSRKNTGMSSSQWYRRYRTLFAEHTTSLGGIENIAPGELAILRRAITQELECERREVLFARAAMIDDDALCVYNTTSHSMSKKYQILGLQRRARDVGPSLSDIIRQDQEAQRQRHAERRSDPDITVEADPP